MISLARKALAPAAAVALVCLSLTATGWAQPEGLTPQQAERFLRLMSNRPLKSMGTLPGMSEEVISKITKFRKSGSAFTSLEQFRSVTGLTDSDVRAIVAYNASQRRKRTEGGPLTEVGPMAPGEAGAPAGRMPKRAGAAARKPKAGAEGKEEAGPVELNLEVRGHYYSILPGYDLSDLPDEQRRAFLDAINEEMCPCGCVGETLGYCIVNDPGCMVVRARVRKIYKDITGKEPPPGAGSAAD